MRFGLALQRWDDTNSLPLTSREMRCYSSAVFPMIEKQCSRTNDLKPSRLSAVVFHIKEER